MTKKPERTLELHVDVDAPLEEAWKAITEGPGLANWFAPVGEVSGTGVGATVKTGWSEEMMMAVTVDAWEPMEHVRWLDASGLYNLRVYLEMHLGKARRMISERLESPAARAVFWRHLVGAGGLVVGGAATLEVGKQVELRLGAPKAVRAIVEVIVEGHALGLRIAELGDALLFVELEGKGDRFHVGYWLSVYDEAQARSLDSPARSAFHRIHEALGAGEGSRRTLTA